MMRVWRYFGAEMGQKLGEYEELINKSNWWTNRSRTAPTVDDATADAFDAVLTEALTYGDQSLVKAECDVLEIVEGMTVHDVREYDLWGVVVDQSVKKHRSRLEELKKMTSETIRALTRAFDAYTEAEDALYAVQRLWKRWNELFPDYAI